MTSNTTLRSAGTVNVGVNWTDSQNQVGPVAGATTWTSDDPTVCTVVADTEDSLKAVVTSIGPAGVVQIIASATTDSGKALEAVLVVTVTAEPVAGTIYVSGTGMPPPMMM